MEPGVDNRVLDVSPGSGVVLTSIREILTDHLDNVHGLHPSVTGKAPAKNGGRFYSDFKQKSKCGVAGGLALTNVLEKDR
ncbi:hypothetical protein CFL01nite_23620 [Corynebacterium flavescens]|uniref:Uncharacterized protein n=1 Tax=Corynebacterium flavescens TaxID=28028 RepID=A0AB73BAP0_CORFL|nr:hypothetical protein CFL01nite_23620 [Corynebacterium flavescens]